jgi:hypothetical protein
VCVDGERVVKTKTELARAAAADWTNMEKREYSDSHSSRNYTHNLAT